MRRTSFADMACSLARSLEVIGDWWVPLILRDLNAGVSRFNDLAEDLGIARNLLAARLDDLVEHGIVETRRYSEHPPRDEYRLTASGREVMPVLMALTAWGDKWRTPPGGPPARFEHHACGQQFTPQVTCSHCGQAVTAEEVTLLAGPGARAKPGTRLLGTLLAARRAAGPRR